MKFCGRQPDKDDGPCLIVLENCELSDQMSVTGVSTLPGDASVAGFRDGQVISVEDALYGLMLRSGADAALSLAIHTAGSEEAFVEMMNQRAQELGMENTHFMNTHGLDEANHVSTARDMALLVFACMRNTKFRTIVSTTQYTQSSGGEPDLYQYEQADSPRATARSTPIPTPSASRRATRPGPYCLAAAAATRATWNLSPCVKDDKRPVEQLHHHV